jgi:Mg2+-importing ATPase
MDIIEIQNIAKKEIKEIIKILDTSENGISESSVNKKIKNFGLNEYPIIKINLLQIFLRNFSNFFNLLFVFALILSFFGESKIEFLIILISFLLSISVGIFEDWNSEKLVEKLIKNLKSNFYVKRDGKWTNINETKILPGDYIRLKSGDIAPADIYVVKENNVFVNESIFTGESDFIKKSNEYKIESQNSIPKNVILCGSEILKGEVEGFVFATGKNTYLATLSKKVFSIKKTTGYEKLMNNFSKNISIFFVFLVFLFFIFKFFILKSSLNIKEFILFCVVLILTVVPEFLPTVSIISVVLGIKKLIKKGIIVKRFSAVEDFGLIEILCSDKTGTLTENKLITKSILPEKDSEKIYFYFLLPSFLKNEFSPYDEAILNFLKNFKIDDLEKYKIIEEVPFDPDSRVEIFKIEHDGKIIKIIKGAPEKIFQISNDYSLYKKFEELDKDGLRTLSIYVEKDLEKILGLISFEDPIKESSFKATEIMKKINVKLKILTGNSPNVALKVAEKLKIQEPNKGFVLCSDLKEENLKDLVKNAVFARLLPEDKLKIINELKKESFVAFLGEGINDILAIKAANLSLVVDSAPDISKNQADVIVKNRSLDNIVDAILNGRIVVENIGKYFKHTLSGNIGNFFAILFLSFILPFQPLSATQVILTNLLTDLPLFFVGFDRVNLKDIKRPVKFSNKASFIFILIFSILIALSIILSFYFTKNFPKEIIQTAIFFTTTNMGILVFLNIRTKQKFYVDLPPKTILITILICIFLANFIIFNPETQKLFGFKNLSIDLILKLILINLTCFLLCEISKYIFYRKFPEFL